MGALAKSSPAAGTDCTICLGVMRAGVEVKTLPCMHVFHRKCIDRWLLTMPSPPRCPIDQAEVDISFAAGVAAV